MLVKKLWFHEPIPSLSSRWHDDRCKRSMLNLTNSLIASGTNTRWKGSKGYYTVLVLHWHYIWTSFNNHILTEAGYFNTILLSKGFLKPHKLPFICLWFCNVCITCLVVACSLINSVLCRVEQGVSSKDCINAVDQISRQIFCIPPWIVYIWGMLLLVCDPICKNNPALADCGIVTAFQVFHHPS